MAVEAGEDDGVARFWVMAKDGAHFLREKNGAAPAMRDAGVF